MGIKSKSYAMDLICAVDHLEKILTEKVPMGEQAEAIAYMVDKLVTKRKKVEVTKLNEIKVVLLKKG